MVVIIEKARGFYKAQRLWKSVFMDIRKPLFYTQVHTIKYKLIYANPLRYQYSQQLVETLNKTWALRSSALQP